MARAISLNILFYLAVILLFTPAQAHAQGLPGAADPNRFEERFIQKSEPAPEIIVEPEDVSPSRSIPFASDGFELRSIRLEGNTVFSAEYFDSLVTEYIGGATDLAVLNHIAARITQIYRKNGYFLTKAFVPEQEIENGVVTIRIIEGYVSEVSFSDPDNLLQIDRFDVFFRTVAKIKALSPLHGPTLERYMLLLNDTGSVQVQSILKPVEGTADPGAVHIMLEVQKKPQGFMVDYNNHGSRYIGPHQLNAGWTYGGLLSTFDRLDVGVATAIPVSEVQFGSFSYNLSFNEEGLSAFISGSYSNSRPGSSLRALEVESDATEGSAGVSWSVVRSRRENLTVSSAFSILNSSVEFLDEELSDDKVRTLSLDALYQLQDNWKGTNDIGLSLVKGIDVLNASKAGAPNLSREEGRSSFKKFVFRGSRLQFLRSNLQLYTTIAGQYASDPLLSSQEFGYGGTNFGRAYDPSEITGDKGISASVELRYDGIMPVETINLKSIPFVYYDIGKVWNNDHGTTPESGASAGFGLHYFLGENITGSLQAAWPLTRSIDAPVMNNENGPRVLFRVRIQL